MSEEEIKKLSKKLAQTLYDDNTLFFSASWTNSNPIDCKAYELEKTLEVLLRNYCIVPKSKIKELYNKMELDGCHIDSDNDWALYEAMDELEKIFPELFE